MANLTEEQRMAEAMGVTEEQVREIISKFGANQAIEQQPISGVENVPVVHSGNEMFPTSVFDLQSYSRGTIVRFPDFAEGQPLVARVRRPSMLIMAKQGKIPNTLLTSANELFSKGGAGLDGDNESMLADICEIVEIMCNAALVEPTYQQIKDAGLELSDEQLMAIFNYTQTGVKALNSFR